MCKSAPSRSGLSQNGVNMVHPDYSSEEELLSVTFDSSEESVHTVNENSLSRKRIFATMEIATTVESDRTLKLYSKSTMPVSGTCRVSMPNPKNNKKCNVEFVVEKGEHTPLIGSRTSQQMNLVTVQHENIQQVSTIAESLTLDQVNDEFGHVFQGHGCIEGKIHLEIDKTVTPVINPPQRVPFALKEKLKSELDRLEGLEMIPKVKETTQWVSSLVVVENPNGKLRICIDPVHLNQAL